MGRSLNRSVAILAFVTASVVGQVAGARDLQPVTRIPVSSPIEATLHSVVVERGDHLWKISARHLTEAGIARDIAPYWREVIALNTENLESGDPNLIYAGEVIALPEVDVSALP